MSEEDINEPETGAEELVPPPYERVPGYFQYVRYITETDEAPEETRRWIWAAFAKDIKLGNLNTADEAYIRTGMDSVFVAIVREIAQNGLTLNWTAFKEILAVRTLLPAFLSRGRHGFERTMQNAQISATISGGQSVSEQKTPFARVAGWFKKAFGGGEE